MAKVSQCRERYRGPIRLLHYTIRILSEAAWLLSSGRFHCRRQHCAQFHHNVASEYVEIAQVSHLTTNRSRPANVATQIVNSAVFQIRQFNTTVHYCPKACRVVSTIAHPVTSIKLPVASKKSNLSWQSRRRFQLTWKGCRRLYYTVPGGSCVYSIMQITFLCWRVGPNCRFKQYCISFSNDHSQFDWGSQHVTD